MGTEKPQFSHIVCSASTVREALAEPPTVRNWWLCVLALHGKPVYGRNSTAECIECVATGFKFYAHLYRFLSALFLFMAPCVFFFDLGVSARTSQYWSLAIFLTSLYLWCATSLGYAGATAYRRRQQSGRISLLVFMVSIVAFLCSFVAATSMVIEQFALAPVWMNIVACSLLFALGIGSYFIEIIYLATDQPFREKVAGTSLER